MSNGQLFEPGRRWEAGDEPVVDGVRFLIEPGEKSSLGELERDLRCVHWDSAGRKRSTKMELGFFLADFFSENESALHPSPLGRQGSGKFLQGVMKSIREGYGPATAWLEEEARRKHNGTS